MGIAPICVRSTAGETQPWYWLA